MGCGTWFSASTDYRTDGTISIKCQASLPRCLERAEDACSGSRYEVLSATDSHDYYGPGSFENQRRSSEALIRCGPRGRSMFGSAASKPAAAAAPAPLPPPPPATRVCVPGATQ